MAPAKAAAAKPKPAAGGSSGSGATGAKSGSAAAGPAAASKVAPARPARPSSLHLDSGGSNGATKSNPGGAAAAGPSQPVKSAVPNMAGNIEPQGGWGPPPNPPPNKPLPAIPIKNPARPPVQQQARPSSAVAAGPARVSLVPPTVSKANAAPINYDKDQGALPPDWRQAQNGSPWHPIPLGDTRSKYPDPTPSPGPGMSTGKVAAVGAGALIAGGAIGAGAAAGVANAGSHNSIAGGAAAPTSSPEATAVAEPAPSGTAVAADPSGTSDPAEPAPTGAQKRSVSHSQFHTTHSHKILVSINEATPNSTCHIDWCTGIITACDQQTGVGIVQLGIHHNNHTMFNNSSSWIAPSLNFTGMCQTGGFVSSGLFSGLLNNNSTVSGNWTDWHGVAQTDGWGRPMISHAHNVHILKLR